MIIYQQGDVLLYQSVENGEIIVENGITTMTGGFETAIYLSWQGGNDDDSGTKDDRRQYWQNCLTNDPAEKLRSEVQRIISGMPLTSANLRLLEAAGLKDLEWMSGSVSTIEVAATIPRLNWVDLTATIEVHGKRESFTYGVNWEAMRK